MSATVIVLPTIQIERHAVDPRVALMEIFGGRVDEEWISALLVLLHRQGLRIVPIEEPADE